MDNVSDLDAARAKKEVEEVLRNTTFVQLCNAAALDISVFRKLFLEMEKRYKEDPYSITTRDMKISHIYYLAGLAHAARYGKLALDLYASDVTKRKDGGGIHAGFNWNIDIDEDDING